MHIHKSVVLKYTKIFRYSPSVQKFRKDKKNLEQVQRIALYTALKWITVYLSLPAYHILLQIQPPFLCSFSYQKF